MAICLYCNRDMTGGFPCNLRRYKGEHIDRIPNGDTPCHDCATPAFGLHHPGCDAERCPKCGGQSIACDCTEEDDA